MALGYKMYAMADQKKKGNAIDEALMELNQYLNEVNAQKRKAMVTGYIDYELTLLLAKGKRYSGIVQMTVHLAAQKDLFIDFEGTAINKVVVNGRTMHDVAARWNRHFLLVSRDMLQKGENKVTVSFQNDYSSDGEGLHSMTDTDGQQYLYSNLEPAYCRKWFPCLDQPDLKASLALTTLVPNDWVAISNELLVDRELPVDLQDMASKSHLQISLTSLPTLSQDLSDLRVWSFEKTKCISTYLMAVCAGPYREIKAYQTYKSIPMSLWCRTSCFDDL